jgi:tetratricopeptide (TPR) repeat protein
MPPWKAEPGYGGDFVDQHPLTGDEIDRIERWVEAGAPEGDPAQLPRAPTWPSGWQLGIPDQVLTFDKPYALPAGGADLLRVFVLRIPGKGRRYVRGLEFRPGNPAVVHHANIRIDRTSRSRELDAADPSPGYDGLMANSAQYPDGHFLGWTPGQVAPLLPKGLAWTLEPGTDLVVELHLQPTGKPETVAPSFGFYYSSDAPDRTPAMLRLGKQDIDIPAGASGYTITDSYVLPVDVEVEAVQPHAHYRARDIRGAATLPDGTTRWLIVIKDWDFRWQHVYRYVKPFELPRGTTLTMQYTYDNSAGNARNPRRPPERAVWGQRSSDEMGNLWIQVQPKSNRDLGALNTDFRRKAAADDAIGYEMMLRRDPLNVAYHNDAALLYLELGQAARAAAHFQTVAELHPKSAAAWFNLGTALLGARRVDEAIGNLRRAIALDANHVQALTNLGNALVAQGVFDEAIAHYSRALAVDPANSVLHNNLGRALELSGNARDAQTHFRRAAALDPRYAEPHYNLGRAAMAARRLPEAVAEFRKAIELAPEFVAALVDLAEVLCSSPDGQVFDPDLAVRLAERASTLTERRDARVLEVLGQAYAAKRKRER